MAIGPFPSYAPPGVYTSTTYEQISGTLLASLRIPAIIGPSTETKITSNYELIRGSSSSADILVGNEDVTNRWVTSNTDAGIVLGTNDGTLTTFQVVNYPIMSGVGDNQATTDSSKVTVLIDGENTPVLAVEGTTGLVTIASGVVTASSFVTVTYYFDRTDTQVTDTLTSQVTATGAVLTADADYVESDFGVLTDDQSKLYVNVNGGYTVSIDLKACTDLDSVVTAIDTASVGIDASKTGSKLVLTATNDIVITSNACSGALGFTSSLSTNRNRVFKVYNRPIVDGSNGAVVTNYPSSVSVQVGAVLVTPTKVDGVSGEVTLPYAPATTDLVKVTYYYNTWQNTFDYLPESNVSNILNVGISPGRKDFVSGTDFVVVKDGSESKMVWGSTASVVPSISKGTTVFGTDQITASIAPTKISGEVVGTGTSAGLKIFSLANLPVGPSASNGRLSVGTTKPADISVYYGADYISAVSAGLKDVLSIDGKVVTLKTAPGNGVKVFVTYYYDRLAATGTATYTMKVTLDGASGTGQYQILDSAGSALSGAVSISGATLTEAYGSTDPVNGIGYWINPIGKGSVNKVVTVTDSTSTYSITGGGTAASNIKLGQTAVTTDGFVTTVTGDIGSDYTFTISTSPTFTADGGVLRNITVPGVNLNVTNTLGTGIDSTTYLKVYNLNNGSEPSVGSSYYVSYEYGKTNFSSGVYQDLKAIAAEYGDPNTDNPLSLAARLAIQNGATVVALKQVKKEVGKNTVATGSYLTAIDEMKKPLGGSVKPHVIAPLSADPAVAIYLNRHCIEMSAPRMESERMGVVGTAIGTTPAGVQKLARSLNSELMMVVYPDSFVAQVQDRSGVVTNKYVDGTYVAAALAGSLCSTSLDVATPVTRRIIGGFTAVGRVLDPTEANQIAVSGVTVMEQVEAGLRVRHGLTTNVSTVLTRTPSVTMTVQDIQRSLRASLDQYIGQKFTSVLPKTVEQAARSMFQGKIDAQIVSKLVDLVVYADQDDPTVMRLESVYVPVFPLEYVVCNLSIRVRS